MAVESFLCLLLKIITPLIVAWYPFLLVIDLYNLLYSLTFYFYNFQDIIHLNIKNNLLIYL